MKNNGPDQKLVATLKNNGVVIIHTDTIPGIATKYTNQRGLERIFKLKKREPGKAVALLIGNLEQLKLLTNNVPEIAGYLMKIYWPGGLTIVLPAKDGLSRYITSEDGIAVRMPAHEELRDVITKVGVPIAATSVNQSGMPLTADLNSIPARFSKGVDYIEREAPGEENLAKQNKPSTVVKITDGNIEVIRQGTITLVDTLPVLKSSDK